MPLYERLDKAYNLYFLLTLLQLTSQRIVWPCLAPTALFPYFISIAIADDIVKTWELGS